MATKDDDATSVEAAFDELMIARGYDTDKSPTSEQDSDNQTDTDTDADATNDTTIVSTEDNADTTTAGDLDTDDIDWKAKSAEWEQKYKSFEGRMNAEFARRREEDERRQQQYLDALTRVNIPSQQKKDTDIPLNKFKQLREDFPEIADAVEEYIKNEFTVANEAVKKEISTKIEPLVNTVSRTQLDSHINRVLAKHPDASEITQSTAFEQWIEAQPSFIKAGALQALSHGGANDVISLLDQYKSSINKNQTNTTAKPNVNDNKRVISSDLAAAARAGLVVKSDKTSTPNTNTKVVNDDDFNAAWDEAVAMWEKSAK